MMPILRSRVLVPGRSVAMSSWLMPDDSIFVSKVDQVQYDDYANGIITDVPGKPHPRAVFLMAMGGIPALNTPTGWPDIGDMWEHVDEDTGKTCLVIAASDEPSWGYSLSVSSDPGKGKEAVVADIRVVAEGQRVVVGPEKYDFTKETVDHPAIFGKVVNFPAGQAKKTLSQTTRKADNHRSVTFDASSSAQSGAGTTASSLTYAHVCTSSSDRYITVGTMCRLGQTVSGITYAGSACTQRVNATNDPSGTARVNLWDRVAPATGSNNIIVTYSGATSAVSGGVSAYGVDQTSPRYATASQGVSTAGSTTPGITVSSLVNQLVVVFGCWEVSDDFANTPLTLDASWTQTFQLSNWASPATLNTRAGFGSYIAGAASSVTQADTLSQSQEWVLAGVAIAEATATGWGPLLGLQRNQLVM